LRNAIHKQCDPQASQTLQDDAALRISNELDGMIAPAALLQKSASNIGLLHRGGSLVT